jgi:hypothetical protein
MVGDRLMANTELARKMLRLIKLNREAFDMDTWFNSQDGIMPQALVIELENDSSPTCGTTMCLAGWAAVANGWVLKNQQVDGRIIHGAFASKESTEVLYPEFWRDSLTNEEVITNYTDFPKLGSELLDIPLKWADALFGTTADKAEYFLELLASGREFDWEDQWQNWKTYAAVVLA